MSIFSLDFIPAGKGTRLPSSAYKGRNGFYPSMGTETDRPGDDKPSDAALSRHRMAMYLLTQKDRPIPSLEEMEEDLKPENTNTLEAINARIEAAKEQHLKDLQRMHEWHAREYLQEAKDKYLSFDEDAMGGDKVLETFYGECRRSWPQLVQWEDDIALLNYTHLKLLLHPLYEQRAALLKQAAEEEARAAEEKKRREAEFPLTKEEFFEKGQDVQERAIMLLTSPGGTAAQEKMLQDYGWAWRQVRPLMEVFEKDNDFKAHVISQRITLNMSLKEPKKP